MGRVYIITGANGHLASTLIRYLRREDCRIRGLIPPWEQGENDDQLMFYRGDVSKMASLQEVFSGLEKDEVVVVHAAGIISIDSKATPMLYRVNVKGTQNVVEMCLRSGIHRMPYVSSVHAIPEMDGRATISETNQFSKDLVYGAYAATKAQATQSVLNAVARGLDAVVVHPSGIIGPYNGGDNYIVQLIQLYLEHKLPAAVNGGYDFVDVRDVAKGCLLALQKGRTGACYILSNRYFSIQELLTYTQRAAGGRGKLYLPTGLARALVPVFSLIAKVRRTRPLYTSYALHTISSNEHFSHDKASAELGYQPRDMMETIRDTVDYLQGKDVPLR
ncbi:MAG: NAD-dependent epimerase/dehydratase family protein [Bilifractor sp.]|jgi:dihydroflavonol-4-reductase